jgi:hypothetical protein
MRRDQISAGGTLRHEMGHARSRWPDRDRASRSVASALRRLRCVTAYEEAAIGERQHLETVGARLLPHPLDLHNIIRFEAHLTRQLYQALHELEAMRTERRRGQVAPLPRVGVTDAAGVFPGPDATTV